MKRVIVLLFASFVCWLFSSCGVCFAEEYHLITPQELTQLETNIAQLESINKQQQQQLIQQSKLENEQAGMLKQAKSDLEESQKALQTSKQELSQAQQSLQIANAYLEQYAKEERLKQKRLKQQRTLWTVLAAGAVIYAIAK